ncbi:hypothetical protein NDU88_004086 [Pleurodeles waltl]|uniref:Uncharacterized protein n=1 Tax=Pleurodeles waltl TaxID=8319 RepID=A0AAV7TRK7_PLEWA|nr:hypothetical protein NDU88_004086 [Pleurodeles waltl]
MEGGGKPQPRRISRSGDPHPLRTSVFRGCCRRARPPPLQSGSRGPSSRVSASHPGKPAPALRGRQVPSSPPTRMFPSRLPVADCHSWCFSRVPVPYPGATTVPVGGVSPLRGGPRSPLGSSVWRGRIPVGGEKKATVRPESDVAASHSPV